MQKRHWRYRLGNYGAHPSRGVPAFFAVLGALGFLSCGKLFSEQSIQSGGNQNVPARSIDVLTKKGHSVKVAHSGAKAASSMAAGDAADPAALGLGGLRRLTKDQYTASVSETFGFNVVELVSPFMRDPSDLGFPVASIVSPDIALTMVNVAEAIAESAASKPKFVACAAPKSKEACLREILSGVGLALFRRPLLESETALFLRVANTGGDWNADVRALFSTLLQHPSFLYLIEPAPDGRARPLKPYEWLTRATLVTTGRTPSLTLLESLKAETELTLTREKRERIVSDLLASREGRDSVDALFNTWLELEQVRVTSRPNEPLFSPGVATDLASQAILFTSQVFWSPQSDYRTLLTSQRAFVNAQTAPLHGLQGVVGSESRALDMPPGTRAGLLTLPAVLIAHSNFKGHVNPIYLGKYLRKQVLCQRLPAIVLPADALAKFAANAALSYRERFREHSNNPACAGCHRKMDEMTFAFEDYSDLGIFKLAAAPSKAKGLLVDVDGKDREFAGPIELGALLAESKEAQQCYLKQLFRRGFGRMEQEGDRPFLEAQWAAFAADGFNMREAFIDLVAGDAFATRTTASDVTLEVSQ